LEKKELKQAVIDKIETLGNKEKKVLYMRNGFDVDDAKTLEEIATSIYVKAELDKLKIRQLEKCAIQAVLMIFCWLGKAKNLMNNLEFVIWAVVATGVIQCILLTGKLL